MDEKWLVHSKRLMVKTFSNPLIVDNLLKIVLLSTHQFHVQRVDMVINPPWNLPFLGAKGLTIPEQTATGVNTPGSDENRLKFYVLMYIPVHVAVAPKTGSCCLEMFARPESLIRRRNLGGPSSLFDFEEVMSIPHNNMGPPPAGPPLPNNGPPPVVRPNGPAPRSTEELCQPSINGRGEPIAPILIEATNFGLRHHMIQQFQNTCQFHGLPGDDANRHIDKFLEITQHMKQKWVVSD
ncbi:hypothetical protein Tco_0038900 [Tanacetum coccineum]